MGNGWVMVVQYPGVFSSLLYCMYIVYDIRRSGQWLANEDCGIWPIIYGKSERKSMFDLIGRTEEVRKEMLTCAGREDWVIELDWVSNSISNSFSFSFSYLLEA